MVRARWEMWFGVAVIAGMAAAFAPQAAAQGQAAQAQVPKRINLVVGTGPGGGFDQYGRMLAKHMERHFPGNPSVVVQNMPGAGGIRAMSWLGVAPADGSSLATMGSGAVFAPLIATPGATYDATKYKYLISLDRLANFLLVWHTTPFTSARDAFEKQIIIANAPGPSAIMPAMYNRLLGTKFKIVTGYESGTAVTLAIERGEVEARGTTPWTTWRATRPDWVRDGKIVPIVQMGLKKDPDIPQVPMISELAQNEEQRQIFDLISANVAIERPFAAPPEVPADRLALLRNSFAQMAQSPALLKEAERQSMDIDPMFGEELHRAVQKIVSTPASVAKIVKDILDAE